MEQFLALFSNSDLAVAFEILVLGWGGIFVVMIAIYLISLALARLCPPERDK